MYRAGTAGTFKVRVCLNECAWVCSGGSLGLHVGLLWPLAVLLLLLLMLLLLMLLLLLLAMLSPLPPPFVLPLVLMLPTLTVLLITSLPHVWLILGVWPVAVVRRVTWCDAPRPRPVLRWQRPRHHYFPTLPLPLSSPPPSSPAAIVPRRAHRPLALTEPRHRICQPPSPPSPPPSPPLLSPPPSPPLPSPLTSIAAALATPSPFVRPACGHVATHVARTATRSRLGGGDSYRPSKELAPTNNTHQSKFSRATQRLACHKSGVECEKKKQLDLSQCSLCTLWIFPPRIRTWQMALRDMWVVRLHTSAHGDYAMIRSCVRTPNSRTTFVA